MLGLKSYIEILEKDLEDFTKEWLKIKQKDRDLSNKREEKVNLLLKLKKLQDHWG